MRPAVPELSAAYSASYPHNCFAHENMKFAAFPGAPLDLNPVVDPSSPINLQYQRPHTLDYDDSNDS